MVYRRLTGKHYSLDNPFVYAFSRSGSGFNGKIPFAMTGINSPIYLYAINKKGNALMTYCWIPFYGKPAHWPAHFQWLPDMALLRFTKVTGEPINDYHQR